MELVTETEVCGKLSEASKRFLAPPERELTEAVLGLSATPKSLPAFLASDKARWITGASVPVDGGSKL